jgi:putative ABC transport system permease protein
MTFFRYVLRSLVHYRFAYAGVLAGAVLGATVLLGALFAGDSVAASLRRIGEQRIGRATHLITAGDRFFREALAGDLAAASGTTVAPLVYVRGTATHSGTNATASQIQLIGVTDAFWSLAPAPASVALDAATPGIAVNDTLARRLNVKVGDTLVVRLHKPGIVAGNAPVAGAETSLQSVRGQVAAVVGDASFGRFTLETTQVPQASVFLPIQLLQATLERPGRANVLLIEAAGPAAKPTAEIASALRGAMKLADYGLALKWRETAGAFDVTSDRVFIDPELATAVTQSVPSAQPVVSYLVNEFRIGERSTPYSIAAATTVTAAPFLPPDLGEREIVLNDWMAEDLQAKPGDDVRLTFFQAGAGDALVEKDATFRVRSIVPLQGLAADQAWMPDFPGISETRNQSDWDPGLPLNLERVRDKDEKYWDDHRGTPKAFLSLAGGRGLWSTRWGSDTALRIASAPGREADWTAQLLAGLRPEMNQLLVRELRTSAQNAAQSPVDFGGLFVGMSFFLILAALGLVAMLFQLSLLQRNREDALLGAVGLSGRKLLRWRMAEAAVVLGIGCLIGFPIAALYTQGILRFLESIWAGQGAGSLFRFAAQPASVAIGVGVFLLFSLLAVWLAIRRQAQRALSIRLAAQREEAPLAAGASRKSRWVAVAALLIAGGAIAASGRVMPAQGAFYLAGFALLVTGLAWCRAWMTQEPRGDARAPIDAGHLGALNVRTRRSRSLTVVGLIATAVFMVLSVASFRKQVGADWLEKGSGTGGFAFWVETTAAQNPSRDGRSEGFEVFASQSAALGEIVPLRAGVGDNANCFNLNSTAQPRLLAVDSARLAARAAFRLKGASDWNVLRAGEASAPIPALVDETTLLWALKRKVGDVLSYTDENGRSFDVRIAGTLPDSLFQGYLVVDEARFLERFPSHPGYSVFLVDARNPADIAVVRQRLESAVADVGGRVATTRDVLTSFHQIENTYIAIFNVLGSLGVILGSLGLAIVVARNLRERRGEFAVMGAMGIPQRVLARMVYAEFGRLVLWGIVIGAVASLIAVGPNLTGLPAGPTLALVGALLAGIVALNLACGWAIFRWSVRELRPGLE